MFFSTGSLASTSLGSRRFVLLPLFRWSAMIRVSSGSAVFPEPASFDTVGSLMGKAFSYALNSAGTTNSWPRQKFLWLANIFAHPTRKFVLVWVAICR